MGAHPQITPSRETVSRKSENFTGFPAQAFTPGSYPLARSLCSGGEAIPATGMLFNPKSDLTWLSTSRPSTRGIFMPGQTATGRSVKLPCLWRKFKVTAPSRATTTESTSRWSAKASTASSIPRSQSSAIRVRLSLDNVFMWGRLELGLPAIERRIPPLCQPRLPPGFAPGIV